MKCHNCRRAFAPKRTDQIFHNTKCRMEWFGRKAKAAMKFFDLMLHGDPKAAQIMRDWRTDCDRRAAQ